MAGICEGRVVVITGAGRGIGRENALAFAREGARVVVNDVGGGVDGSGADTSPAESVATEIRELGGQAVSNADSVVEWDGAGRIVQAALDAFGGLDKSADLSRVMKDLLVLKRAARA